MTSLDHAAPTTAPTPPTPPPAPPAPEVGLGRLRSPVVWWALAAAAVAALGQTSGTVVAGRLAERPTAMLVTLLALAVVGAALLDTVARSAWWTVVDRAEGRLRGDLLAAALQQPLSVLSEQAVGEVLDRVDDDTHELGNLLRLIGWDLVRTLLRAGPMWVVAGLTWWPAWLLFPLVGVGTVLVVRPLTGEVARRKLAEEVAWTEHAAALEEGVAARDDVRSSLGQAFLVRRNAELSAEVHARVAGDHRDRQPDRPAGRTAAARAARRHGGRRGAARRRGAADDRRARHAVPRHDDVRRQPRPDQPAPARAAGRPGRPHPGALAAGGRARADRRPTGPRRPARRRRRRAALLLRRGHLRPARRRPARPGRADRGPGRSHRLGEVDPGRARLAGDRAAPRSGPARRRGRPRPGPAVAAPGRRRGHPAHRRAGRDAARQPHPVRRRAAGRRRRGGGRARAGRLGRRAARRARHRARAGRDHAVGRRGAARGLRPAARAGRAGRGAGRGHGADGPGDREPGRPGLRAAAGRPDGHRHRAPAHHDHAGGPGRGPRAGTRGADRSAGAARAGAGSVPGPARGGRSRSPARGADRSAARGDGPPGRGGARPPAARERPRAGPAHGGDAADAPRVGARRAACTS
jgi:hypothetical protein